MSVVIGITLIGMNVRAAEEISVADTYFRSMAYPETFTDFAHQNRARFGTAFHRCLDSVFRRSYPAAEAHMKRCNQIPGYGKDYEECINSNDLATVVLWTSDVRQVTREGRRWEETQTGNNFLMAKQMGTLLDPGFPEIWVQTTELSTQMLAPVLSCE